MGNWNSSTDGGSDRGGNVLKIAPGSRAYHCVTALMIVVSIALAVACGWCFGHLI